MSIYIENIEVKNIPAAMRGIRNSYNSWDKQDTIEAIDNDLEIDGWIGENDHELAMRLIRSGSSHRKFLRMMTVTMDITAPRYWWMEFDTYKVGTVANSCSTMHTIMSKEFEVSDFSTEYCIPAGLVMHTVSGLNMLRSMYLSQTDPEEKRKTWYHLIQILPQSYNQKRTVLLNYEVLRNIYEQRRFHKLDEWREFCEFMENLFPYSEFITEGIRNES